MEAASTSEPTLPELLRSSRFGRAIGAVLIVLAIGLVALFVFGRGDSFSYEGSDAPRFSISWGGELEQVDAGARQGALLVLEGEHESLSIRPLDGGESLSELGIAADASRSEIESEYPGARVVLEGRTELAVDRGPDAYQLGFTAPAGEDGIVIGKRFLVPDPDRPGEGVEIEIAERTSNPRVIEKVADAPAGFFGNWPIQLLLEDAASVRTEEGLEKPLRSFEFG